MKNYITQLIIVVLLNCLNTISFAQELKPIDIANQQYVLNLKGFEEAIKSLKEKNSLRKEEEVKESFLSARIAYKKIEFIIEYLDPQFIMDHINGAPLPKVERNVGNMVILQPKGLQRIDEVLFNGDINWLEADTLIKKLEEELSKYVIYHSNIKFTDRQLLEACKEGVVRCMTMGITGFDKPYSTNHLNENLQNIKIIHDNIELYKDILKQNNKAFYIDQNKLFKNTIEYFKKHQDFNEFNRYEFIKEYGNPLLTNIVKAHHLIGIETIDLVTPLKQSTNYEVSNLFNNDFINIEYFTIQGQYTQKDKIADLGKILFFDPILSGNNKRACASCHDPKKGFTDNMNKSLAFDFEGKVGRNAPTIINAAYSNKFFHDMRANRIEAQPTHVIINPKEFNSSFQEITSKLNQSKDYVQLFEEAFPEIEKYSINQQTINIALAEYMRTIVGFDSPFDKNIRGEANDINDTTIHGFNLFMGKAACATCHFAPTFSGLVPPRFQEMEAEVLGVPLNTDSAVLDSDPGKYNSGRAIDQHEIYRGSFKTASIRNISLTAPYMHNGGMKTLDEVMNFYNNGGGVGAGFNVPHQTLPPDALELNDIEIDAIINFMQSLTDTTNMTSTPKILPHFEDSINWNKRVIGGSY